MIEVHPREGHQRVRVIFTDRDGAHWLVTDAQVVAGHTYARAPGESGTSMRGFVNLATGERRRFMFGTDSDSRAHAPAFLQAQLEAATPVGQTPSSTSTRSRPRKNVG